VIDAHIAGASLLAGAVVGAGIGGVVGWWTAGRLVRVKVLDIPLGGKQVLAGPTRNLNFPHVVFNRARYHHLRVAQRNHAVRGVLHLSDRPEEVLPPLTSEQRARVERCFAQVRKAPEDPRASEALRLATESILTADDQSPHPASPTGVVAATTPQ
jgi:hypothetical protein